MATLGVTITSPPPDSTSPSRTLVLEGGLTIRLAGDERMQGRIQDNAAVSVRIGDRGTSVAASVTGSGWRCSVSAPPGTPEGVAVAIRVSASVTLERYVAGDDAWEPVEATAATSSTVRFPAPLPPVVTIDPVPAEITAASLPLAMSISGTASGRDAPVMLVQYFVEGWQGAPFTVVATSAGFATWKLDLPVPPGEHQILVRAIDRLGSAADASLSFEVVPATTTPAPPRSRVTLSGAATTASVTSWTRLEPTNEDADMGLAAAARVFDPLWMLARQWQLGEFQAEDAGTPVQARIAATTARLSRCHVGALPDGGPIEADRYDPAAMPLEVAVERRRMRPADPGDARMLPFAVDAGLHFLHMLEARGLPGRYRAPVIALVALQPLPTDTETDGATLRYLQTMAGRAPDGRRLAARLRGGGSAALADDPALAIAAGDRSAVRAVADAWLQWYDAVFSEPASGDPDGWSPGRLEHGAAVAAGLPALGADELTLTARALDGTGLDWSSFDIRPGASLGAADDGTLTTRVETTIPAPVGFPGAPAPRFWEIEDARLAYGLIPCGPTDLIQLMVAHYTSSYGNDWLLVPLTLPVGSLTRIDSLIVTDTFGSRSLLRPIGDPALPAPHFAMWQQSTDDGPDGTAAPPLTNCLLLTPALADAVDGPALDDVRLMRDEMANLVWAIERAVEGPLERPLPRGRPPAPAGAGDGEPPSASEVAGYRLGSEIAPEWIPLLPVASRPGGPAVMRRPAAVLRPDGRRRAPQAFSEVLRAATPLLVHDEEVPREGIRVVRRRRLARWLDGTTWLWTGFRATTGRGEGHSGLRFDQLVPTGVSAAEPQGPTDGS